MTTAKERSSGRLWGRLSGPLKVGIIFAGLGLVLAIVGILRGMVPPNPLSIFLALLISGGSWGVVSWAVATAAADVDRDVAGGYEGTEETEGAEGAEGNEGNQGR
ncbi:MAG: hypothetical protein QHJ81_03850 [Anaerolineae bacterium]|nr:hypothetical protein [Anaerolineae bacterium]